MRLKRANAARLPVNQSPVRAEGLPGPVDLSPGSLSWLKSTCYLVAHRFVQTFPRGGADKNLDWFYAAIPRLTRYSIGLREPREILIRFSLYQRM